MSVRLPAGVLPSAPSARRRPPPPGTIVVVIAPDRHAGRRYAEARSLRSSEVVVVTEPADLIGVARLKLRRRDQVAFLRGWHAGCEGRTLASTVERMAQVGGFGSARQVLEVDA